MNEYLASALIFLAFSVASFFFAKAMIKIKSPWLVVLLIVIYFVLLDAYFELVTKAHQILRDHGIYIEFGHADLLLLMIFAICLFLAVIMVATIVGKRLMNKKMNRLN